MAHIILTPNPFEPFKIERHEVGAGVSIREFVSQLHPSGEFPVPTVCLLNGEAAMRKDWDRKIEEKDIVNFITIPAGVETIIILVIAVALVAISILFPIGQPKVPGELPASDPVFSTKGQQNAIRSGEPIEVCYGRNRIYPSYASRPYFEYHNNDQFQFSLFCLGQGEYEIHDIQIGDTDINDFEEVQYEVVPPGDVVTLFPHSVYTATEVGGQTLFGPNEEEYTGDGWVGPFPANQSGTDTEQLQVDMVFPKGVYKLNKKGKLQTLSITFQLQYREIDDLGTAIGDWEVWESSDLVFQAKTTTPQRRTYTTFVPLGRYEVRARRTNDTDLTHNAGHEIVWEALRAYLDVEQDYGNVTLLAIRARATNNLNERTQQQFNVIATRKLPIRESGDFSEPQATRSIVWALVDVFRSQYGGRITDDDFFDWDTLEELDALYAEREEYFDWVFRDPITVWEAAKTVARVGRATPLLAGSLITMKRDGPQNLPVAMFNQENIVQGTLQWDVKLWDLDEYDCIRAEYTDPATGYKQEIVTCILPGGTSDHPEDVRFPGIQSRAHAYHEGLYLLACRRHLRENATFDTGLEGYIPTFGDLIVVAHDVPRWNGGGYVVHAERGAGDIYQLWLSAPVEFELSTSYQIMLRGSQGQILGPFTATATEDQQQIVIHSEEDIDFLLGGQNEPMLYMFGVANSIGKYMRVVKIEPQGNEIIRIIAVNDAPIVHTFDDLDPTPLEQIALPPVPPAVPEIDELTLTQLDSEQYIVQASWTAAFGAQYYIIQSSEDGDNWQERGTTTRTSIQFQALAGDLWVRVAAVNEGQGPWIEEQVALRFIIALVEDIPWEALEWQISWQEVLLATGYVVKVYDNTQSEPVLERTETVTDREYNYDYTKAVADGNLNREMLVTVDPIFVDEDGEEPTELELSNAIPTPVTITNQVLQAEDSDDIVYRVTYTVPAEGDLVRIVVYLSETDGFTPGLGNIHSDFTAGSPGHLNIPTFRDIAVPLDSNGEHAIHYYRIGIFDVWGDEISTNLTSQQTIPAYS